MGGERSSAFRLKMISETRSAPRMGLPQTRELAPLDLIDAILLAAVGASAFLQSPTVKLGARFRVTDILLLALVPWAFARLPRALRRTSPAVALGILCLSAYLLLTLVVGIATALTESPELTAEQLEFFRSPFLRTTLESLRFATVLVLLLGFLSRLDIQAIADRVIPAFLVAAALSAWYGIYQVLVYYTGVSFPMLPGTSTQGTGRPFSTFYEPTGFGSFAAVALFYALPKLLRSSRGSKRYMTVLTLIVITIVISFARTALLAVAVGFLSALIISRLRLPRIRAVVAGAMLLMVGFLVANFIFGASRVGFSFSPYTFQIKIQERLVAYRETVDFVLDNPVGVGQGNYVLFEGGAPGFARIAAEGGIPGILLVFLLTCSVASAVLQMRRFGDSITLFWAPWLGGAYAASVVVLVNYINVTDVWLWIPGAIALAAWHSTSRSNYPSCDALGETGTTLPYA